MRARAIYAHDSGYNVLFPMGFDAFGLPAENAAIKNGVAPAKVDVRQHRADARPTAQHGRDVRLGARSRSCDPEYYKWTQWFFKKLIEAGLAYREVRRVTSARTATPRWPRAGLGR
jgi:leucyl-tRNA synthetase